MIGVKSPLLEGISAEACASMETCFDVREQNFRTDDVIYDFADGRNMIGIVSGGTALVERVDERGGRSVLEHLESGGVFGEMLMFENTVGDSIMVICEKPCHVSFIPAAAVTKRCENACESHSRMVENMFRLVADKATSLSERVEVLSRRSIRDKLLCYFSMQSAKAAQGTFALPFSLSTLADYISADRSAMMRELKKMRDELLVRVTGRQVTLLG